MNPEFRRKSGHTYKYLVLRPNEREEVYYLDTGMFQNLEIRKTRRNKQRGLQPIKWEEIQDSDFLEGRRSVLKKKGGQYVNAARKMKKMKGNH